MFTFKKYVSLGSTCRTRHQLDRIFKQRNEQYVPTTGFFDWLWGPAMPGVIFELERDFQISMSEFDVKLVGEYPQVFNRSSEFYFLHDFIFSDDAVRDIELARNEMVTQFGSFQKKYNHLAEKLMNLIRENDHICFVYFGKLDLISVRGFYSVLHENYGVAPPLLNILQVSDQVECDYFEDTNFPVYKRFVDDRGVAGTEREWMGVDSEWDSAMKDFYVYPQP